MKQVKVKPLVWGEYAYGWDAPGIGPQSRYNIYQTAKGLFRLGGVLVGMDHGSDHPTLESAKAAAQADYEQRILSLLEP